MCNKRCKKLKKIRTWQKRGLKNREGRGQQQQVGFKEVNCDVGDERLTDRPRECNNNHNKISQSDLLPSFFLLKNLEYTCKDIIILYII